MEFNKFGDVLSKVKKQLNSAANTIDSTQVRTRAMARRLKGVEALPNDEAGQVLGLDEPELAPAEEAELPEPDGTEVD